MIRHTKDVTIYVNHLNDSTRRGSIINNNNTIIQTIVLYKYN